jgi:hypothetical protein
MILGFTFPLNKIYVYIYMLKNKMNNTQKLTNKLAYINLILAGEVDTNDIV